MQTMTEDHHIQKSLDSIEGMTRASASPFLFGKIMSRFHQSIQNTPYYTTNTIIRFAISMVLILAINVFSMQKIKNRTQPVFNEQAEIFKLADEYFGYSQITPKMY